MVLSDVVFSMAGHVEAGSEMLDCVYMRMPADRGEIAVGRAESHYTPGSHHFLVYRTNLKSIPDGTDKVHPCSDFEQIANVTGSYYEAQSPDTHRDLPDGVAHVFAPGEILLFTAHYLNAANMGFDTNVEFRLHTMPRDQVRHEAGSIFFYNPQIDVPPMSDVTVVRTCPLNQDIQLALLWSHMHSRGIAFHALTDDPTAIARVGELYTSLTWSEPEARAFPSDPPITLHAGSNITYSCTYHNTTSQTFVAGNSAATNEMCILHGMYWPRLDPSTEECLFGASSSLGGPPPPPIDAGIVSDAGPAEVDAGADAGNPVADAGTSEAAATDDATVPDAAAIDGAVVDSSPGGDATDGASSDEPVTD